MNNVEHETFQAASIYPVSSTRSESLHGFNRILVVDDDPGIRVSVSKLLEFNSYIVDTASSASDAFEKLKSGGYNLVISDIMMPGVDGIELLRMIKEHDKSIQVIMITASATIERSISCLKHGASDFIKKPFRNNDILESVDNAVKVLEADAKFRDGKSTVVGESGKMIVDNTCKDSVNQLATAIKSIKGIDSEISVSDSLIEDVENFKTRVGGDGITMVGSYSRFYGGLSGAACLLLPTYDGISFVEVLTERDVNFSSFPSTDDKKILEEVGSIISEVFVTQLKKDFNLEFNVTLPDFVSFPSGNFVSLLEIRDGRRKKYQFFNKLVFHIGEKRFEGYFLLVFDMRNLEVLNSIS